MFESLGENQHKLNKEPEEKIDEGVKKKEKEEFYVPIDAQIELCSDKIKGIAGKIDKLVCDWECRRKAENQPRHSKLDEEFARHIDILSAQLAAKKAQLEILNRDLECERENTLEEDSLNK